MDHSPYSPPRPTEPAPAVSTRTITDTLFFVVNASCSTLFVMLCVISLAAADNPFAFMGGLVFVLPAAIYSIAEWRCWYRRQHWLKRPLGVLNLSLAAFFVFGFVTNVGEAVMEEGPVDLNFLLIFGLGFAAVAGYLAFCGWHRIQDVQKPPDIREAEPTTAGSSKN